jgi:predicted Zn-dependent protease
MAKAKVHDTAFEITFYESVLKRNPSYATVIEILGGLYTRQGRVADGLRMDRKLVRLQPGNATARYNLACSLALSKRKSAALSELKQAVQLGYRECPHGPVGVKAIPPSLRLGIEVRLVKS